MFLLNPKSKLPLYEQLVEQLRKQIVLGNAAPGSPLPSVRQLSVELGVNPNTIQKAYAELERRGYIYTVKGRGNFVSYDEELKEKRRSQQLEEFRTKAVQAMEVGVTKAELLQIVNEIFEKEGGVS